MGICRWFIKNTRGVITPYKKHGQNTGDKIDEIRTI